MEHALITLDPERETSRKLNSQSTDSKEELASPGIADDQATVKQNFISKSIC